MKSYYTLPLSLACAMACLTGCCRTGSDVWEDTKSAGRHVSRGFRSLCGGDIDSRQIRSRNEFMCDENPYDYCPQFEEYVPLPDQHYCGEIAMADISAPPPRECPGDPGSSIPGIEAFKTPDSMRLGHIFRNVQFDYNSNAVNGSQNLETIRNVSYYMRQNPRTHIFIAGHCDERGPEAYNLSLGSRRSNAVRNMLIQEGVNPENIHTISYGKERPLSLNHNDEAWAINRRAEFRILQR